MDYKDKIDTYLKSGRRGKSANDIERKAMDDVFLDEALDGFAGVNNDKELLADMDKLQKILEQRVQQRPKRSFIRWIASAAAVLLVFVTGYWFLQKDDGISKEQLAVIDELQVKEDVDTNQNLDILAEAEQPGPAVERKREEVIRDPARPNPLTDTSQEVDINRVPVSAAQQQTNNNNRQVVAAANKDKAQQEMQAPITTDNAMLAMVDDDKIEAKQELESIDQQMEETVIKNQVTEAQPAKMEKGTLTATPPNKDIATGVPRQKKGAVTPQTSSGGQYGYRALSGNTTTAKVKDLEPVDGMKKYEQYLEKNLVYPADAKELKKKGKVTLSFLIGANGRPSDIKVEKSLYPSCDDEAVRLINEGGDWTPSKTNPQKRVKIKVEFNL